MLKLKDPNHPEMGWVMQEEPEAPAAKVPTASRTRSDSCAFACVKMPSVSWLKRKSPLVLGLAIVAVCAWRAILYYKVPGN